MEAVTLRSARPQAVTILFAAGDDGTIVLWSPGAQRLYGLSEGQARGRDINSLFGGDLPRSELYRLRHLVIGARWACAHHIVRGGKRISLMTTFTVAEGPDGQRELLASTTVTAPGPAPVPVRVPAGVPRCGRDLTFLCAENMVIQYVGSQVRSLLGYLPREVVGRDIRSGIQPTDHAQWQSAWEQAVSHAGQTVTADIRVEHADGRRQWIRHALTNRLDDAGLHAMVVNVHNVEDLREANRLRDISEQTLLSVLEASVEGVWLTDADGGTSFLNSRMSELLGLGRQQILTSSVRDVLGDSVARLLHTDTFRTTPGVRDEHELRYLGPDGNTRWLRIAVTPRFDAEGAPSGSIVMCAEIAERHPHSSATLSRLLTSAPHRPSLPAPIPIPLPVTAQFFDRDRTREIIRRIFPALSPRESEIVTRLYLGDRVPAIARALIVSQSTVRNQLASAFRKAGVATQQDLITLARNAALR